jgi:Flp pilus assembly protein TadD
MQCHGKFLLALLRGGIGDLQQAVDLLGRAARGDPGQAGIRLNYVRVLILAGKKADARREIDELVKLGDKFPARAEIANLQREL